MTLTEEHLLLVSALSSSNAYDLDFNGDLLGIFVSLVPNVYCRVALLPSGNNSCLAGHYLYFFVTLGVAPRNRASGLLLCSLAIYSD